MKLKKRIEELLFQLVHVPSETFTSQEVSMANELLTVLKSMEYFKQYPNRCGLYSINNDPLNRSVVWGLVKGAGSNTVVLINHLDTVDTHDYLELQSWACKPKELAQKLRVFDLSKEVLEDLNSNDWFFGRGVADMKGGAAVQLALLEQYGLEPNFEGNIIFLSVPDEENLSAGMRAAVLLLTELKEEYNLDYKLLIDVETHVRRDCKSPVLYSGSIGKVMPAVFVRGVRAHIGNVFQGFSPVALLAEIAAELELNQSFSDEFKGEKAPPPTWMYFRDGKVGYDVSIAETAFGYTSILTFNRSPQKILEQIKAIALDSFNKCLDRYKEAYQNHYNCLPKTEWKPQVLTFSELYHQIELVEGEKFVKAWHQYLTKVNHEVASQQYDMTQATNMLMEFVVNKLPHKLPVVVIGFAPPYYPHVVNASMESISDEVVDIDIKLKDLYYDKYKENLDLQYFYTAISDMSYASLQDACEVIPYLAPNMPLWGRAYEIPLDHISQLQIPSINLGPWGKDLHMHTERVYKRDLLENTPWLMDKAIRLALEKIF